MSTGLPSRVSEYSRKHKRRRCWQKIVSCLGAAVVFCTTYALILPAITMESDPICGIAEHTHGEECYESVTTPVYSAAMACAPEVHVHLPACYDETGEVICGLADVLIHTHDENCYYGGQLICPLPEAEEHLHSEGCYEMIPALVCTTPETPEGHTHGEECYLLRRTLTCGLDEIAVHTHSAEEGCFDTNGARICGILAAESHQHTGDCLTLTEAGSAEERHLVCTLPEHTHHVGCYPGAEDAIPEEPPSPAPDDAAPAPGDIPETIPSPEPSPAPDTDLETDLSPSETIPDDDHTDIPAGESSPEAGAPPENGGLTAGELTQAEYVSAQIDALPDSDEISTRLTELEAAGDYEGMERWYNALLSQVEAVQDAYAALHDGQRAQVANADKLLELEWIWSAEVLTENFAFTAPTVVQSASTSDFIDLNLYDYNGKINEKYNSDKKYPGFQWNGGAYMNSRTFNRHVVDYIDFGNSNITDIGYGGTDSASGKTNGYSKNKVTVGVLYNTGSQGNTGAINWLWWNGTNASITNRPVGMSTMTSSALSHTLINGYPALADGTSLSYLFTNGNAVTKQNTQSIDGLFRYDDTTSAYYYNSRENHAQYSNNTFTLYDQIITPNFIVYPFGNFLPFNTITDSSKATQVSSINNVNSYIDKLIDDMADSVNSGKSPTKTQLTAMLEKYQVSNTENGITTSKEAITDYLIGGGTTTTDLISDAQLNRLYNIDWDEETNFFFGMNMSMNFFQPKGGMTGKDTNGDGTPDYPMEFYFTGDDDVWVYIDDVLFLDLSGIHRHVGGKIDFVEGEVYYYELDTAHTGDVSGKPYATYTFAELLSAAGKSTNGLNEAGTFQDYSTHTFKFYYMERGSGSSVCRMNFNFPLLRKNSISVTKELTVDDTSKLPLLGNPDFKFQILKENKTDLFIGGNVKYNILDTSGNNIGTGTTDENGVFTLKAGQTAVFSSIAENAGKYFVRELLDTDVFGQYGKVSVNGSSITQNYNVTVGSDKFTGLDSPIQNVSNGSTVFRFDNRVTTSTLGSLTITKTITGYPQKAKASERFDFEVTLDGEKLPAGTKYTVDGVEKAVVTAGIITLSPGETATISNILAGTRFTVTETQASAQGYVPSYTVDSGTVTADFASGVIGVNSTVAITVNNAEKGASVEIPVTKALIAPDGQAHTYQFALTQVTDSGTTVENGTAQTLELTVTAETVTGSFILDYPLVDLDTLPQSFYYKIAEVIPTGSTGTIYDRSVYVVEVTITGEGNAEVTGIWKDGAETTDPVAFTNQLLHYELPQTGGAGTFRYLAAGALLMVTAVLLLYRKRRGKGASPTF